MATGYRFTVDQDPFLLYEEFQASAPLHWDESVNGWLVTRYDECARVLQDEESFNRAERRMTGSQAVRGGWRNLATLGGDDHRRLHNFLLRLINMRRAEDFRDAVIRPTVERLIARFAHHGTAELANEFADDLPIRVGCTLLGLDVDDDLVQRVRALRVPITRSMDTMSEDPEVIADATAAIEQIKDLFIPIILKRKEDPRDDLISEIWRHGPSVFPDWNEKDTFAACLSNYSGGEIKYLLRNMIHGVLIDPDLRDFLLSDTGMYLPRYAEEAVRQMGAVHWQIRIATADTELGGRQIRSGDRLFVMIAAANRDERHFSNADRLNLDDRPPNDHLGYGRGPRYCPGVHTARVEVCEALECLLRHLPNLRLDEREEAPRLVGWHLRSYQPLNARFDPIPHERVSSG